MKKQIKKLRLNKKTISNLSTTEMSRQMGAGSGTYACISRYCGGPTRNGKTCPGHNTCATGITCSNDACYTYTC